MLSAGNCSQSQIRLGAQVQVQGSVSVCQCQCKCQCASHVDVIVEEVVSKLTTYKTKTWLDERHTYMTASFVHYLLLYSNLPGLEQS